MERVNQLERDLKALKNKVSRLEKNGGRNKNGGDDGVIVPDPALAPARDAAGSGADTREKEGGIGKFLDGIFGTKAPVEANNEMRDVASSMTGGRARSAKHGRRRRHRNNKKSRKNKRTAKRGGTGAGCAKRNARNNKNKKNTRRNKNQRRRNTRRHQNGGG